MHRTATTLFFLSTAMLFGCGAQPPSREELGRIAFKASEVPGADDAYSLPEYLREALSKFDVDKHAPGE
ncbi:MAG TPA: hypothetical protein VF278_13540 [Pirellulales bacterium]